MANPWVLLRIEFVMGDGIFESCSLGGPKDLLESTAQAR
jgi:hypothetical protein